MRASVILLLVVALVLVIVPVSCMTRIGPGRVGIKIDLAGSQRGVEDLPLRTGWVFNNPFASTIIEYPTSVQTARWTRSAHEGDNPDSPQGANEEISFNDCSGLSVTADVSLSYHLDPTKIPQFYVKFRSDDILHFTHGYLRNVARDAFNDVGGRTCVQDIMGPKKEEYVQAVRAKTQLNMADVGVIIDQLGFIESPRPPQPVIDAINSKVQATQLAQQKQNELMQSEADAKKRVAQAQGEADANRVLASSITPQLLDWQRIALQYKQFEVTDRWISRWNGQMPQVNSKDPVGLLLEMPKQQ